MMWVLSREWSSKNLARKDWAAFLGQGFAAGVGIYNNLRMEWERGGAQAPQRDAASRADLIQACQDAAIAIIDQKIADAETLGHTMYDIDGARGKISGRIKKALSSYIVDDPIPDSWRIVSPEHDFGPGYGNARADLIARDQNGALTVVDYKTKLTLKAEYRQKTVMDYANSHQMLHYAWAVGEAFGETVATYSIGLAVFEPRWAFDLMGYAVHPETLSTWLASSKRIWALMETDIAGGTVPYMSANHSDNFGQCPYYKACFVHHYDPTLMEADYVAVSR